MPVIYEFPGGTPRFFVPDEEDGDTNIYEYGTRRAVYYVQEKTVYAMDGTPAFWLGERGDAYLHPFDGTRPHFYFDLVDRKPGDPKPEKQEKLLGEMTPEEINALKPEEFEALSTSEEGRIAEAEFAIMVHKFGRRAAIEMVKDNAKKKK
jgi:hypothetical protein